MRAAKTIFIPVALMIALGGIPMLAKVALFPVADAAPANAPVSSGEEVPQVASRANAPASSIPLSEADEKILKSLNLRQKIGQLFMIGFMGSTLDGGLGKLIETVRPGAIVVFGRNIKSARQIATLNLDAQKAALKVSKVPLLIAVDQEGGNVIRIKTAMPLPSALALGETGDGELVETAGRETGTLLRTLGFNMNLAPVLDVSDPSERSFIGTRTFGSEPNAVLKMGVHFARGLQESGVLATGKHFPGHGGIREDSHHQTPEKPGTLAELMKADLLPFVGMAKELTRPWAVMLAHIAYPGIDPSGMPATFSKPIIDGVLRKRIGFDGLVITDDIEMAGAFMVKDVNERAIRALEAGVDMVMVAWNRRIQTQVTDAIFKAVKSGRITEERIDASVRRILAYKRLYVPSKFTNPTSEQLRLAVRNPAFQQIAEKTVSSTLKKATLALNAQSEEMDVNKPVFVFTANDRFYSTFKSAIGGRRSRVFRLSSNLDFNIDRVMRANPDAVGVFYLSSQGAARIANRISDDVAKRIVVVNVETEGLLKNSSAFRKIADVYYKHPNLGLLTARHFFAAPEPRNPAFSTTERKKSVPVSEAGRSDSSRDDSVPNGSDR